MPGLGSRGPKANQLWDIIEGIPTISRGGCSLKTLTFKSHSCLSLGFFGALILFIIVPLTIFKNFWPASRDLNRSVPSARAFSLLLSLPLSPPSVINN